jgi:hypothetical protein
MNTKRILDVVAVLTVGDGLLWVVAPRRRGLLWLAGPASVKRLVEGATLERPWLARLIGGAQVAAGLWMALRAYPER